jgi:hypothetical protein
MKRRSDDKWNPNGALLALLIAYGALIVVLALNWEAIIQIITNALGE